MHVEWVMAHLAAAISTHGFSATYTDRGVTRCKTQGDRILRTRDK